MSQQLKLPGDFIAVFDVATAKAGIPPAVRDVLLGHVADGFAPLLQEFDRKDAAAAEQAKQDLEGSIRRAWGSERLANLTLVQETAKQLGLDEGTVLSAGFPMLEALRGIGQQPGASTRRAPMP